MSFSDNTQLTSAIGFTGKNIVFGSCDLYQGGDIVASGTQQMKVFRNSKDLSFNTFFSENVTHIR